MVARIAEAGGSGDLSVEGTVTQESADQWRLHLVLDLDGERDTRVLWATDCRSLADAVQVLITVRLDREYAVPEPDAPVEEPEDPPPPSDDVVVVEERPVVPVRTDRPEVDEKPRARLPLPTGVTLGVAAGLGLGATPAPGVPLELAVGWAGRFVRVAARGRWYPPRQIALDGGRAAVLQLGVAGLEVCGRPAVSRLELPVCAQTSIGGSRSAARGPQIRTQDGLWVEAGIDAGVAWHVRPRLALTARLGAAAVLAAPSYAYGEAEVFEPSPVHGRVVFGVELTLPIQISAQPEKG